MRTSVGAGLLTLLVVFGSGSVWAADTPQATEPTAAAVRPEAETGLTLGEDIVGEVIIRNAEGDVVAQLQKREGRSVLVPLEPGRYEIECVTEPEWLRGAVSVGAGQSLVVGRGELQRQPAKHGFLRRHHKRERVQLAPARPTYDLRVCRLTMDMGGWADGNGRTSVVITDDSYESHNGGFLGGMTFGYRISPDWMVTLGVSNRLIDAYDADWHGDTLDHASFLTTLSLGARYYPRPMAVRSGIKPYVSAGIGPTFGVQVKDDGWLDGGIWRRRDHDTVRSEAVFGGYVGAGFDIHASKWLVIGTDVTYHISPKLDEALGDRRDTRGFAFTFQIGANFGRRLPKPAKS